VIEVRQYIDRLGRNPFERWFDGLDDDTQARVVVSLDRLERATIQRRRAWEQVYTNFA